MENRENEIPENETGQDLVTEKTSKREQPSIFSDTAKAAADRMLSSANASREEVRKLAAEEINKEINKEKRKEESENASGISTFRSKVKYFFRRRLKPFLIGVFVFLLTGYGLYEAYLLGKTVWCLDSDYLDFGWYRLVIIVVALVILAFSSLYEYWNYHRRKRFFFFLIVMNLMLCAYAVFVRLLYMIVIPLVFKIPITEQVSVGMVVLLARFILTLFALLICIPLTYRLFQTYSTQGVYDFLVEFRLGEHLDFRKNKKLLYDVRAIRDMDTGRLFKMRENDRFLHMLLDGVTGAGKTSLSLVKIADDIDRKVYCEDLLKKKLVRMMKQDKVYMTQSFQNRDFNHTYFRAKSGHEKEFAKLLGKYRGCGLTVVAPDASLTDKVFNFCEQRGIPCNRIDPMPVEGTPNRKKGWKGFNPLYISPDTPSWQRSQLVVKKATLMADVLLAIYEMKGKSDPYFVGLNRAGTTSVTICLLLTFPYLHPGIYPTPVDVQSMVNDFSRIRPYYKKMMTLPEAKDYEFVLDFISYDLLGAGATKMAEQMRGLRTIFNEFLVNPLIRDILCAQESVDLDRMLSRAEVTVVNFALDLGRTIAVGFGDFFVLSFIDAVMRRPGDGTAPLHFVDVDEAPLLMHPDMESMITLFRKFKVGTTFSIQTLDQFARSETTKYLRGVILGNCAHQIIYGRSSSTEMQLYCELAGVRNVLMEQETVSQTSITLENTALSYSTRTTPTQENVIEEVDIRNRKFQEVNVFAVVDSSTIPPFHGKTFFLPESRLHKVHRRSYNWERLYESYHIPIGIVPDSVFKNAPYESAAVEEEVSGTVHVVDRGGEVFREETRPTRQESDGEVGREERTESVGREPDENGAVDLF